ncbi:hypothetical protein ACNITA_18345, partial [Escherichia coli]
FCSLLAPSDAILFQEGVSVKLRLPQTSELLYDSALAASYITHLSDITHRILIEKSLATDTQCRHHFFALFHLLGIV